MPDWKKAIHDRIASAGVDTASTADVVEELAQHFEQRYQELRGNGVAEQECIRCLEMELDSDDLISCAVSKPRAISAHSVAMPSGKPHILPDSFYNLRLAFRSIRSRLAFSTTVIAILALGIGGNSVIFSVFNGLYLRPLPFPDSGRLVDIDETAPKWNLQYVGVSAFDLLSWRKNNQSFENMAFFRTASYNLASVEATWHVQAALVTHDMLDVLRLSPALGRDFNEQDDEPSAAKVVLLSYPFWLRNFQGDRNVIGRTIKLDEESYSVVGVLPSRAVFPGRVDLWMPLAPDSSRTLGYYVNGIGRLKGGVSIGQAQADLLHVHKTMIPEGHPVNEITSPILAPIRDRYLGGLRNAGRLLMAGVALVLLIVCVDISALLLVRAASRSHEIAVRMAIGASRGHIAAQLFTENLVLTTIGAILGVASGETGLRIALSYLSARLPQWVSFSLDWRFGIFLLLITCGTALLFGVIPTLRCTRMDIRGSLGGDSARATSPGSQRKTLGAFVVCQVAFALVLSVNAGLLVQAFRRVLQVDPGFNPENVLLCRISLPELKYESPERKVHYYDSLLARLQAVPGVNAAAATSSPPLGGHWGGVFEADREQGYLLSTEKPTVLQIAVTPSYFNTVGMTLLAGRAFNGEDDQPGSPMVVVVNETFARHFWGNESPIGKRIRRPGAKDDRGLFNSWFQVVGLIRDERHDGLDQKPSSCVFLPLSKALLAADSNDGRALRQISVAIRSAGAPQTFIGPAREIAHELDPDVPIYLTETLQQQLDDSLWARRVYSWLFQGFAAVAVLLAMAGVYGVMSYTVSQRTQEYGIRMALGAQRSQVLRHVLVHGFTLVLIGVAIGAGNGLWATNLLRSMLFGVGAHDLFIFSVAVIGISGAGLVAALWPALRAASVSPLQVLRSN